MMADDRKLARTKAAIENARAAGDEAAVLVLEQDLARMSAETHKPQPAGAGERFVRGMVEPVIGAGQLMSRPLALLGRGVNRMTDGIGGDYLESLPGRMDEYAEQYSEQSEAAAPDGTDVARAVGQLVTLAPTALAGGAPATIGGLARAGGVVGGVTGATQIAGDPSMSFAGEKTLQTGGGAALGAVASPLAGKLLTALGRGAGGIVQAVRRNSPVSQIRAEIEARLIREGIDPQALGGKYLDEIARQVRRAKATGGDLDGEALARLARFKQVGIDDPTVGQVTQDPVQFSNERWISQSTAGRKLADQYKKSLVMLNSRIDDLVGNTGRDPVRPVEAGQQVFGALKAADAPVKKAIDDAYAMARDTNTGVYRQGVTGLVRSIDDALERADLDPRVSPRLMQELGRLRTLSDDLADADARTSVDLKDLEKARRFFSSLRGSNDKSEARLAGVATRAYDKYLSEAPDALFRQGRGLVPEGQEKTGVAAFNEARRRASERFKQLEKLPVLDDFLSGNIAPDDFMRKGVYGSKLDELKELKGFLSKDQKAAWDQIRVQVLADIKDTATKGSPEPQDFSQAAFNRMLTSLDKSGKLDVLFTPRERSMLKAIGEVGRNIQRGPPGQVATGFAGSAKAMNMFMRLLQAIPGRAGSAARAAGENAGITMQAEISSRTPSVVRDGSLLRQLSASGKAAGPAAGAITSDE